MTQTDFITEVTKNVKVLMTISDETLLEFVVAEVVDRVSLWLNLPADGDYDQRLARVVARVACGIFSKSQNQKDSQAQEMAVTSISDNGQSISYSASEVKSYLATAEDNAIFSGFESLLKPYRRVNVVS